MKQAFYFLCILLFGFIELTTATIRKRALIFGITGQDGSYLTEFLLSKGYEIHGVKRYNSCSTSSFIDKLQVDLHRRGRNDLILHWGDLIDFGSIFSLISVIQPDEVYNLGALSYVPASFELPEDAANCDALGTLRILEAIRLCGLSKTIRFFQASTSNFLNSGSVQDNLVSFAPSSPYATAKLHAFWVTKNYREAYNLFACNGILFNHESERRNENFLSRKVTRAVARIKYGLQETLTLGNLESHQDWGYSPDYVKAIWLMLQYEKPDDYVVATGKIHSVREFVEAAFNKINIIIKWQGKGVDEVGYNVATGQILVKVSPHYFRPLDSGRASNKNIKLPKTLELSEKTSFKNMIEIMVDHDLADLYK